MNINKRAKIILVGTLLTILTMIGVGVFITSGHSSKAKLAIRVLPEDSAISIDGEPTSKKSLYVSPGVHKITAVKEGFKSQTLSFTVIKGEVRTVYLLPEPVSAEAKQWLQKNPDIQREREGLESNNVQFIQNAITQKYPIVQYLPLETFNYKIDYGQSKKLPDDPTQIALYITATPDYRDMALHWIKFRGYNPDNYEIIYLKP